MPEGAASRSTWPWTSGIPTYPDPSDILNYLFDGRSIRAEGNSNHSYFDDPVYNRKLAAAARLTGPRRYAAYQALEADLLRNAAPAAPLFNFARAEFFSARIGCQVYQPIYQIDLAALCLRVPAETPDLNAPATRPHRDHCIEGVAGDPSLHRSNGGLSCRGSRNTSGQAVGDLLWGRVRQACISVI